MKSKQHVIVLADDYNGSKNVFFMMQTDDFRYAYPRSSWGYTHIHNGTYDRKTHQFTTTEGKVYRVFEDWSVAELLSKDDLVLVKEELARLKKELPKASPLRKPHVKAGIKHLETLIYHQG